MARRVAETAAIVVVVALLLVGLQNVAIGAYFPHLERLTTDFSATYLQRELRWLAAQQTRPTVFLGDSVVWGYELPPEQTAVAILAANGCACRNLAFKSGSPPNYYALVRLLEAEHVRPQAVVLQINPKVFGEADPAYKKLHPALAEAAGPLMSADERAALTLPPPESATGAVLDRTVAPLSTLYAMRADVRETLFGETPERAGPVSAEMFQASYDLTPLDTRNVGVRFLAATLDRLRRDGIPAIAFMTPTNHALLHEFIDNADYRGNVVYLKRLLRSRGATVIDLDSAFPARDFIDNDHLTAAGQRRLAAALAPAMRR